MTVFDRLAAARPWAEDQQIVIDQVQRVADEILAYVIGRHEPGPHALIAPAHQTAVGFDAAKQATVDPVHVDDTVGVACGQPREDGDDIDGLYAV